MTKTQIRWGRYVLPAVIGTVAGIWLEKHVWKGRSA